MSEDDNQQVLQQSPREERYPPSSPYYRQPDENQIDLVAVWRVLTRYKWTIALVTFLTTAIAVAYALLATPIYRAEVLFVPTEQKASGGSQLAALAGQFGGLANLAGISLDSGGNTETALAILQSREFMSKYIRDRNLLPTLFPERWDIVNDEWIVQRPSMLKKLLSPDAREETEPSMWDAYELVKNEVLSVATDVNTGLITLRVEWRDPELAAEWANNLVVRVNQHIRQQAITEAEKNVEFLHIQLAKTNLVDLKLVLFSLIGEQTKNIMMANVREEFTFKIIDPAVVPEESMKPRKALIVILGFALGGMLGLFVAFVRNLKEQK